MKEKVYFIKITEEEADNSVRDRLEKVLVSYNLFDFIQKNDMVAVKTHFGEKENMGFVKPTFFRMIGNLIKKKGALPFLTETSTLYKGNRSNAVNHIELAYRHGFGYEKTGLPIIMADGLYGDEEIEVDIPGRIYKEVKLAALIVKAQSAVFVSHFTGHIASGFGATLKNMGMGCSSRKGKMVQHSTSKPEVKQKVCTKCGECVKWCPANAIVMKDNGADIYHEICIGCGQCLAVCRFHAVAYNWGTTNEELQKKIVEHAWGVARTKIGKIIYINFLTNISKECDCMTKFEKIVDNIGVLISFDPVALDTASLDLVEQKAERKLPEIAYDIPCRNQLHYAEEIGFGTVHYDLIEV